MCMPHYFIGFGSAHLRRVRFHLLTANVRTVQCVPFACSAPGSLSCDAGVALRAMPVSGTSIPCGGRLRCCFTLLLPASLLKHTDTLLHAAGHNRRHGSKRGGGLYWVGEGQGVVIDRSDCVRTLPHDFPGENILFKATARSSLA